MMNRRHPMKNERDLIRELIDQIGAVEVLRLAGHIIANDHPDLHAGGEYKTRIMMIAKALNEEPEPVVEPTDPVEPDDEDATEGELQAIRPDATTDPAASPVDRVKSAMAAFEAVQARTRRSGSEDTEPDGLYQWIVARAAMGKIFEIPEDAGGWQSYSSMAGSSAVAVRLAEAAKVVKAAIEFAREDSTAPRWRELVAHLRDTCWRVTWK